MELYTYLLMGGVAFAMVMLTGFKTIRENQRGIVENGGKFLSVEKPGVVYIIPFYQKLHIMDISEKLVKIQRCPVITKDNVTLLIDANVYYKISEVPESIKTSYYSNHPKTISDKVGADLLEIFGNYTHKQVPTNLLRISAETRNEAIMLSRHFTVTKIDIKHIQYPEEIQNSINQIQSKHNEREANRMHVQNEKLLAEEIEKIENEKSENTKKRTRAEAEEKKKMLEKLTKEELEAIDLIKQKIKTDLKEVQDEAKKIFDGAEQKSVRKIKGNE